MDKEKKPGSPEEMPSEEGKAAASAGNDGEEKLDIKKSVFQINREMMAERRRQLEEQQAEVEKEAALREKKRQEAYDRRIRDEKLELLRLKQGLIEESETIHEEHEEKTKLSLWKKITNFFYHNKWWLGIGTIIACISGFLIYDYVTKPRPDLVVLLIADNEEIGTYSDLKDYITGFTEDTNKNGKKLASVYYIPYSENTFRNYSNGSDNKLSIELQSADSVIVIGDAKFDELIGEKDTEIFCDLEELFPGNPHVKGCRFMLEFTPFAERIGIDKEYTKGVYLALRKPKGLLYCTKKDMEKRYEKDFPAFERMIEDLSSGDDK